MGIFDGWTTRRRVKEAAGQMWDLLKRGYNFEVPLVFDKNDLTVQAVAYLQKKHPQVQLRMYQSRGLVLGLFRGEGMRGNMGISEATLSQLAHSGHIGEGYDTMTAEDLLAGHERFLLTQGLDPKEEEATAQKERAARERITLSSGDDALDVPKGTELVDVPPGAVQHDADAVALTQAGTLPAEAPVDGAAQ